MEHGDTKRGKKSVGPEARRTVTARRKANKPIPTLRNSKYSQSLERGLAILTCFSGEQPVLGIADVAEMLGMARPTTHRYMATLVALGYLEQVRSRKYRLGLRVTDLGMSVLNSTGLREHSHLLEELRQRATYTASLGILDSHYVLYVDQALSYRRSEIETKIKPGSRLSAHCTSMGKILLAGLSKEERILRIKNMPLTKLTANTITSKKRLYAELEQVSDIAIDDEESAPALRSIAAPVRNDECEIAAAISLTAHASKISMDEMINALGPHLVSTANQVSAQLGYRRGDQ